MWIDGILLKEMCSRLSMKKGTIAYVISTKRFNKLYPRVNLGRFSSIHQSKKRNKFYKGSANPNWKNGKTQFIRDYRRSYEYMEWRKQVFERDKYTCQDCGEIGGHLRAHHIFPYKDFLSLRFEINNGITLCQPCHIKKHAHGV